MSGPGMLTVDEVAALLACTPTHVRRLITLRELRASNLGLGGQPLYRVARADVDALLAARSTAPPAPAVPARLERVRRAR